MSPLLPYRFIMFPTTCVPRSTVIMSLNFTVVSMGNLTLV